MRKALVLAVVVWLAISSVALADPLPPNPLGILAALDMTTLIPATDPALTDPGTTDPSTDSPPHLSRGGPWKLFGASKQTLDPQNPFNDVISFDTHDTAAVAGAFRKFGGHVKVGQLTDMVEVKYFYQGRTCSAGSTRFQLGIDQDGDGNFDHNAFGYLGDKPFGGGCLMGQWVFEDMTDNVAKWDLSKFNTAVPPPVCNMTCTWQQMVTYLNTVFPNHQVLNIVLVDDSQSFAPTDVGCAFFDILTGGTRTLANHNDVAGNGDAPDNCGQ
jgi:hypothetical protein